MGLADRTPPTPEEFARYGDRFSNWGRWGDDDQRGTLNHITPATRASAAALAVTGRVESCARPLATTPGPRNPFPAQHFMRISSWASSDYIGVSYHGRMTTHLDALCHIFTPDGRLYNDRPAADVTTQGAASCSVEQMRNGIVTRGVLYDIPRLRGVDYVTMDSPVHGWDLVDAAEAQGIKPRPGDAVLIRSGCDPYFAANPDAPGVAGTTPGVHVSVAEFLYEYDAALLGWDQLDAGEQGYSGAIPLHMVAIPYMGMPLIDNMNLEAVASACSELGRWEFQLVVAPLIVQGGTGSPVNPIAVF